MKLAAQAAARAANKHHQRREAKLRERGAKLEERRKVREREAAAGRRPPAQLVESWPQPLVRGLGFDDPEEWDADEAAERAAADGTPADARPWAGEDAGWADEDLYAPSDADAEVEVGEALAADTVDFFYIGEGENDACGSQGSALSEDNEKTSNT